MRRKPSRGSVPKPEPYTVKIPFARSKAERMASGAKQANGTVAVEPFMDVEHAASAVLYMANLPLSANVQFMTVMASKMPYIGRG